jgi:hypothetical protein
MSTTETDSEYQAEREVCLYPGCENLAVEGPKTAVQGRTGPPPRYCDNEDHNAGSTYLELKRLEDEAAAAGDAA